MKTLYALLGSVSLFASTLTGQTLRNNLWYSTNEKEIRLNGQRQIIPQKYKTIALTDQSLRELLFSAPNEKAVNINESSCVIYLPVPDGSMQRFHVVESPVMAEELSISFPHIKTFSLRGIDDPHASGKADWNDFGFHAMVFSPNGDFFIDPYSTGTTTDYISYYTTDFKKDPAHVAPESAPLEKVSNPDNQKRGAKAASQAPAACTGAMLYTYRLAVACTGEYAKAATNSGTAIPTVSSILSKVVTTVNRVDGVYEKEVAVRMVLVPSTTLVLYGDPATDAFTGNANNNPNTLINLSQSVITASIGTANYDIGHTFSTGAGGLANLGCVCNNSNKAMGVTGSSNPVGDPYDIDYVAHEIGHQFDANHTFNALTDNCAGNRFGPASVEPGSGVTVMGYAGICGVNNLANNSIPYFHAFSFDEIRNFVINQAVCAVTSTTGNQPPVVTGSGNYVVPNSTPFSLTGNAIDPDGDALTYSWEETDAGISGGNWNSGSRPYFMSYAPTNTSTRFFPKTTVVNGGNYKGTKGEYLPSTPQMLEFRLTVRDNKMGGGGVCHSVNYVTVDESGPLTVTHPSTFGIVWFHGSQQVVTWDVNGTHLAPVSCDSVRILISYNSGLNYSVLVNSAPNDGICPITVPTLTATIPTCRIKVEAKENVFYDIGNFNFTISTDPFLSIGEISRNNPIGLSAWPNPFENQINFAAVNLNAKSPTRVNVTDVSGKLVLTRFYEGKTELKETLDLSLFEPGIYFLQVNNDHLNAVHRIIKD